MGFARMSGLNISLDCYTAKPYITDAVDIEFDPEKAESNLDKHGVPLAAGAVVLENRIGELFDDRLDYGEIRINAFGLIEDRLFVCTYTMRGNAHRIISVRKASRQEQRTWLS